MEARKAIMLRVRTSEGTFRISASPADTVAALAQKVAAELKVSAGELNLFSEGSKDALKSTDSVAQRGFRNGDLLMCSSRVPVPRDNSTNNTTLHAEDSLMKFELPKVEEDEVDRQLDGVDGWIQQKRDERTCFRHPPNGSCVHCMPVAPWAIRDVEPWKGEGLKHIPFTSWLRHRDQGRGECRHTKAPGIFCQNCRPLTEESYVPKKCDAHEPWPKGVCSKCKPDTVRLVRQEYRHVDHVSFENPRVIESLIEAWRQTGCQRAGFLFGRFVVHKDVPLGIKAVVEAVYEPPQVNSPHGLQLKDDPDEARVIEIAKSVGLVPVGFAWTAIEVDASRKIIKSRDLDKTYLASGPELLQSAIFQNEHPSPCRHSMTGKYGSKWVSVLITGNDQGGIEPLVFQVSDQMAGLVRDGIITNNPDVRLLQTVDNPAVYVPKVLYDDTNEYGRAVVREAQPTFPPIPCWVDVNYSAPKQPSPMFPTRTFPVENRPWSPQNEAALAQQLHQSKPPAELFADFAFLLYLGRILDKDTLALICAGLTKQRPAEVWKDVLQRLKPLVPEKKPSAPAVAKPGATSAPVPVKAKTGTASGAPAKRHPNEDEWIATLMSMGFDEKQSRTALEKSKWQGVEAALGFLV